MVFIYKYFSFFELACCYSTVQVVTAGMKTPTSKPFHTTKMEGFGRVHIFGQGCNYMHREEGNGK